MSSITVKTWLDRLCGTGLVLYPFIAHICLYFAVPEDAVIYLAALFVVYMLSRSHGQRYGFVRLLSAILLPLGMLIWARYFSVRDWLYLPPVVMPLWAAIFFLGSLRDPSGAVITRIARTMESLPLSEQHLAYTRRVTLVWGLVLAGMTLEACLLAWLAPVIVWSWWVNIGNYAILLLLLGGELVLRWYLLGRPPQLAQMCRVMVRRPWLQAGK